MPIKISNIGAHKLDDRIYIFGGNYSPGVSDRCFYFDLALNHSTLISNLPQPAHNISCYKKNDFIVLSGCSHSYIFGYHPAIDRFSVYELYGKVNVHKILLMHNTKEYILTENELIIKEEPNEEWFKYQLNLESCHLITPLVRHKEFYYFADHYGSIRRFNTITNQIEPMELVRRFNQK